MKIGNFKPGKKVTVFFVFFACTFFILGLWQIERGQAKSKIIAQFNSNLKEDASYISDTSIKWDRVLVDGEWDGAEQILIDNVINSGIAGYKVLTPLKEVMSTILGIAQKLGKGLYEMVSGDVVKGWETMAGAVENLGEQFDEAWKRGKKLYDLQILIRENNRSTIIGLAELKAQENELRYIAEDVTKSYEDRKQAYIDLENNLKTQLLLRKNAILLQLQENEEASKGSSDRGEALDKEIEGVDVVALKADAFPESDTVKVNKHKDWYKAIKKDIYLNETVLIMNEMNNGVTKK